MQYKEGTLGAFLRSDFDPEFVLNAVYSLDSQMKQIHKKGYCLKNISFSTVIFDEYQNITFADFYKITDSNDAYKDVNDFNNFSMGLFVLISSKELGYYNDISFFDYSALARSESNFILENYAFIKQSIPQDLVDYYDDFISGSEIKYLTDFVKSKNSADSNKSNARSLVKATAVGKALTDREMNNAAFAEALVYPILAICGILLIVLSYLLYVYL